MDFYKRLNYTLGNEDWSVEEQALKIKAGDHVVCVTASGDRPLNLLMSECAKITSVDMNRSQTYLLDLKLAAITQLDYEKYLAFLGCVPSSHRIAILNEIKFALSDESVKFWVQHKKMISRGILYQGKIERLAQRIASLLTLFGKKTISQLFTFSNIEDQREYVQKYCDRFLIRKTVDIIAHPKTIKFFSNDPGLYVYVDKTIHPGKYIYQRIFNYLHHHLAKNSALLQMILLGKILPNAYFPYLTYEGYKKIRERKNCLDYRTDNIVEFLYRTEINTIDAFSMSDIASYMPQASFERMLEGICSAATNNARFCIREFMSKRHIPPDFKNRLLRNSELEKKLEQEESNFVYRFIVGEVEK